MNPAAKSFAISSLMALCFPSSKHVQGFPRKDVSIGVEEVGERAFLFEGKHSADAHHFALRAARVYEDLLGALYRLERPSRPLGVECFFGDLLPDGRKLFGGDNCSVCSQHSTSHS